MDAQMKRSRSYFRNRHVLIGDVAAIIFSVLGSFALRLDVGQLPYYLRAVLIMMVVALAIKLPIYYFFGLYRRLWIYASINELKLIAAAVTTASVAVSGLMLFLISIGFVQPGMPRSALGIDWLLSLILSGGLRLALRIQAEQSVRRDGQARRVLIVGAGDAGALVVRELQKTAHLNLHPVGFLDDDLVKQKQQIYGVPVVGMLSDLAHILESQHVDEVIIAIPSAPGRVVRLVADVCRLKMVPFRTMPGLYELIGGKVSVSRLREVDITDLLRREPARIDDRLVGSSLLGKRVLVTGAGGSIGRELCRQVARWGPAELVLLGHGENSIFESLLDLQPDYPSMPLRPIIADVRDRERLQAVFQAYRPQVVFHAAAHKHVPLMEFNVEEAVANNVSGTRSLVETAANSDVERLVLISTDKAVRPSSVYGATKRLSEMIVLDAAHRTGRAFTVVRFGNVLGSRGSIIPIFKRQILNGGPITITHPDMRRFFMTIPEAVHLVLQAAAMGQGGEVFVLNMGEQVRIVDLAEDLIRLSGLEPGRDVEIVYTGIRPGEKLSEALWDEGTHSQHTSHPEIFRLEDEEYVDGAALANALDELARLARGGEGEAIIRILDDVIPHAAVRAEPPPDVTSVV